MTDCGSCDESCCASLAVTGGTFHRTYLNAGTGHGPSGEADLATVSAFRLDKYDVTVGRFRQFVNALLPADGGPGWTPAPGSGKHAYLNGGQGLANSASPGTYEPGWVAADDGAIGVSRPLLPYGCDMFATWTDSPGTNENLPMNCINWYEAYAFCIWDGGFLPSETEWEYAAAGGSQQREYPWGSTDPGTGNQYAIVGGPVGYCDYPNAGGCTGAVNIAPVGTATLGAGLWGQLDLDGTLWQWTMDWFVETAGDDNYVNPCTDCAALTTPSAGLAELDQRIYRGSMFEEAIVAVPQAREEDGPVNRFGYVGFRCARAP
jgi:formylglycine-generating enzyme required for sulfatase activity